MNQQMLLNMLEQRAQGNPQLLQIVDMAKSGNMDGVANFTKNILREKGYNPDEVYQKTKQQYGW